MPPIKRQSKSQRAALSRQLMRAHRQEIALRDDAVVFEFLQMDFSLKKKDIDAGKKFDKMCDFIESKECLTCHRAFLDLPMKNITTCSLCARPNKGDYFTAANNMDPGPMVPQLMGLTYIEQMLIAQVHPVISLYRVRGAQYCYSGNVINFHQDIHSYTKILPWNPTDLPSTLIFGKMTPTGLVDFRVRTEKIREALIFLKHNNIYYNNIEISNDHLNLLPEDGDISHMLNSMNIDDHDTETIGDVEQSFVPALNTVNQDAYIASELRLNYPNLSHEPIDEFTSEGYIVRAFPTLFPTGNADFLQNRNHSISKDEYFKFLMLYKDQRFSRDARFRFFAMNTMLRYSCLTKSNIFIKKSLLGNMTNKELINHMENNPSLLPNIMVYCASLRSTQAYWRARCSELLQMVSQLGTPTIFFTLSAADYHWKDLYTILAPGQDIATLSIEERRSLMHENPLIVGYFFQKRVQLFLKTVLIPLFNVTDYWYRFEWQFRGSPHVHGVLWIDNIPIPDIANCSDEQIEEMRKHFDKLCTAINPCIVREDDHPSQINFSDIPDDGHFRDLIKLLNTFQRHTKCGPHCLRIQKNQDSPKCRFKFPKPLRLVSAIDDSDGSLTYHPIRNDGFLQRYNPVVTQMWRANTDFTPITSKQAVMNYIAKYASKGEKSSSNYMDTLKTLCGKYCEESPAKTIIRKLIISTVAERDYSAQEVSHIIMGWSLYSASRTFVNLSVKEEIWQRLNTTSPTNYTISRSIIEKYKNRPANFEHQSLLEFAKRTTVVKSKYTLRNKDQIVRVFPILSLSGNPIDDEQYYKLQCILYIPFRGEFESLLHNHPTHYQSWYDRFDAASLNISNDIQFPEPDDEGIPVVTNNDDVIRGTFEMISGFQGEHENQQLGLRLLDIAHEWDSKNNVLSLDEVDTFLQNYRHLEPALNQDFHRPIINFSSDQQRVLDIIDQQIEIARLPLLDNIENSIKRVVIQGKAGSGKSTIIREIVQRITTRINGNSVLIAAPTGAAALNIDGQTIHSLLKLPIQSKCYSPLKGETARKFQSELKNLKFLIIDEMSMVGASLLFHIEKRCREINPSINEFFGGLNILFFGDYKQLPPVLDIPMYKECATNPNSAQGLLVYKSFQLFLQLQTSHRQNTDNATFGELLDRLGNGQITSQDFDLLSTRRKAILNSDELALFTNAMYLFPTNALVEERNNICLRELGRPVARITAVNTPNLKTSVSDEKTLGLHSVLYLSVGCRVMLKMNLWVSGGLVNGSLGTVQAICYQNGVSPPELPDYILVKFDNFQGPYIFEQCFPITPITRTWTDRGIQCSRRQFPLSVAYAVTIHKSQGLTLPKVVVDIGPKEIAIGLTYVALSRVRRLSDIIFTQMYTKERYDSINQTNGHKLRMKFLQSLPFNGPLETGISSAAHLTTHK